MFNIKDHIIVKDNFFDLKTLSKIHNEILNSNFSNRFVDLKYTSYQKIYFNLNLNFNHYSVKEVLKKLKKTYKLNVKPHVHSYFLSTKHEEATPHNDTNSDINCLIYLKGETELNNGTGFYDKNDKYDLNQHVGFKENRAIIFDSEIFHASLQFNTGAGPRYVMANFLRNGDKK